jgi:glutamate-1-semialdehyde 2,1-aminomutase
LTGGVQSRLKNPKTACTLGRSQKLYEMSSRFVPGGVHSSFRYEAPFVRYFSRARGPYVWDVDGNKYIDCIVSMGACILGHADPQVQHAVKDQLASGLTVGLETELSVRTAKLLRNMIPSAEIVKFSNTGTEAVMHAIQISRGYSGKTRIAKAEGAYHGWYDYVLMSTHPKLEDAGSASAPFSVSASSGIAENAAAQTLVIPFNNVEASVSLIRRHKDELAAVILEPVMFNIGCVLPSTRYLKAIREVTDELGIILIFDEVISGFRISRGGAQEHFGVTPDITTLGKAIANGYPLAAVVGRRDFMNVTNPIDGKVIYAGTYNGNQVSLAACHATLTQLRNGRVQRHLFDADKMLMKEIDEAAYEAGIEAKLLALGGVFQVYFSKITPTDYRTAIATDHKKYAVFRQQVLDSGILMLRSPTTHQGISFAHGKSELSAIVSGMKSGLKKAKSI